MINELERRIIDNILTFENVGEIVASLVKRYAEKKPDEITGLIRLNNDLLATHTKHLEQLHNQALHSLQWQVCNIYFIKKNFEVNNNEDFVVAILTCKTLFPEGDVSYGSELEKKYFDSMVSYLKDNLSEYLDSDWANMQGLNSYIKLIAQ